MKNFLKYITVPALIALVFYSCSKDLGNYDYTDANVITVTTDMANVDPAVVINNDSIVVKQNDSLRINILISQTKPSNDLAYEWMIIQSAALLVILLNMLSELQHSENKDHSFTKSL
jgi:hypothetical protein